MNLRDPRQLRRTDRIRPLNLPQPVRVGIDEQRNPTWVAAGEATEQNTDSAPLHTPSENVRCRTRRAVVSIIETWRVDDEWWRDTISRRCFELVLEGGRHVVLYEDLVTSEWFLQRP